MPERLALSPPPRDGPHRLDPRRAADHVQPRRLSRCTYTVGGDVRGWRHHSREIQRLVFVATMRSVDVTAAVTAPEEHRNENWR